MFDVLAVGELNVDVVLTGLKQPPVMGQEILAEQYTECMGSSTAICACAVSSLGAKTAFFGKLGEDSRGDLVANTLQRYGVDTRTIIRSGELCTGVTVSMSMPGDRAMVTYFGDTINSFEAADVPLESVRARHIHVGSYFLQTRLHSGLTELFRRARKLGMTTSLDAGWDEHGSWANALGDVLTQTDYFFPNEKEAACIAGTEDMEEAARRIAGMGCTAVLKLGSKGALACDREGRLHYGQAFRVPVVDTTGAGDSFNAGFLRAALNGASLEECMAYGNATGAVSVGYEGGTTHCPTPDEVERLLGRTKA